MSIELLEHLKSIFEVVGIVLLLLTFVAAAGAWYFTKKYGEAKEEQLRAELSDRDARIAEANAAAAKANEGLGKSSEKIAELTGENLKLSIKLEEERLALEKYKAERAPRTLTREQQESVAKKLKPLARIPHPDGVPERVDLVMFPVNSETTSLLSQIAAALSMAEWNVSSTMQDGASLGVAVVGVHVMIMPDSPKSLTCAGALAAALSDENIEAHEGPVIPNMHSCKEIIPNEPDRYKTDPYCSRILVFVGDHP